MNSTARECRISHKAQALRTRGRGFAAGPETAGAGYGAALFSTITTFGTAVDVTVSEEAVEAFFPADVRTAHVLRAAAG